MAHTPYDGLNVAIKVLGEGGAYAGLKSMEDALKRLQICTIEGLPLLNIGKNENIIHDDLGNILIQIGKLNESYELSGDTPIYFRNHEGEFQYSLDEETWQAVGTVEGTGDMMESVYDSDADGRVEAADELTDGSNTVTPSELRDHLDNHPGGVSDHTLLTNIGTNTHAQLDSHLADSALHEGTTDHTQLSNIGTNTHAQIDSHIADSAQHTDTTDHTQLSNIGTNTHAQLDSHLADGAAHTDTTDHTQLSNIGTNTHAQLDAHLEDTGLHSGAAVYVLRGTGTGHLAQVTDTLQHDYDLDTLTLFGQVAPENTGRAESFFRLIDEQYDNIILDFGKNASNQLYLTQGDKDGNAQTIVSATVYTAATTDNPMEVGVLIDRTTHQAAFFAAGQVEAWQSTTQDHTHDTGNQQTLTLGEALDGDLYWFGACGVLLCPANAYHTPYQKGLGYGRDWVSLWDLHEGTGSTIEDGPGPYNLTVNGSWVQV